MLPTASNSQQVVNLLNKYNFVKALFLLKDKKEKPQFNRK